MVAPTATVVSPPLEPTVPVQRKTRRLSRSSTALLIGLVVVIIAGGVLGSLSLLTHFGVLGSRSSANASTVVRGGTWTIDSLFQPDSLIPNGSTLTVAYEIDQALYLPLFYGDAQGVIHPGPAARFQLYRTGASTPTPPSGRFICDLISCGRMGNPTMPVMWTTPGSCGSTPSSEPIW